MQHFIYLLNTFKFDKTFVSLMKRKKIGSSTSVVHGKEKEVICHDMRRYCWQNNDFLQSIKKKKKKKKK